MINGFNFEYTESLIKESILLENHCHTQYEMIAVLDGIVTIMQAGKKYCLRKNQIIIIPPLLYHSVTTKDNGYYTRITALFNIKQIPYVLHPEFINYSNDILIASFDIEKLKEIFLKENLPYYAPLIESSMIEIFYSILKGSNFKSSPKIETDTFLQQACQYIEQHLHEKILLDDLAKHTAKSKSSFCHLFKEKMNISPKQYILQKRLTMASKLIDEGVPHTVAAKRVGYDNYSNFYKLYKTQLEKTHHM